MRIGEVCLLTNDVRRLAGFYKQPLGVENGSDDETHQFIISEGTALTIQRTKLFEDVVALILERIEEGEWPVGDRLPSEPKLCQLFDVSRSTVRAAIKSLQLQGILISRPGSGTYVTRRAPVILESRALADVMANPEAYRDLLQTRYLLEPLMAGLAAQTATREEADELLAVVEQMRAYDDRPSLIRLGYSFHMALARLSHNRVLLGFYQYASAQLRSMRSGEFLTVEVYRQGIEEHECIARAIADGNVHSAMELMRDHLTSAFGEMANNHFMSEK